MALTFDGGANADGAHSILATLARTRTPATFFLTGRWVETYRRLARTIGRRYTVGNHTYDHKSLTRLPTSTVRFELERAETLIRKATGQLARPLFRFPYGESDARTIGVVNALGYGSIRWTVDTLGWEGAIAGQSPAGIVGRVLARLRPGTIVLMHVGSAGDRSTLDANALPRLISTLRRRGYAFVSVDRFL